MKKLLAMFLLLAVSSPSYAGYARCFITEYDACPDNAMWSCTRYTISGESSDNWVTDIQTGLKQDKAYEVLANLRGAGICP